jgi:hypothetical protein
MSRSDRRGCSTAELLTAQFYEWEIRGRGWHLWNEPVELEPAFRPFLYHSVPRTEVQDDARKPTALSSFVDRLIGKKESAPVGPVDDEPDPEPSPDTYSTNVVELHVSTSTSFETSKERSELLLFGLDTCSGPVSFEVLGTEHGIAIQFATRTEDAARFQEQAAAYFPEAVVQDSSFGIAAHLHKPSIVDVGLSNEFMLPVSVPRNFDRDPLIGIVGALSALGKQETGLLQVLFVPVHNRWTSSIMRAVTDDSGGAFFADAPELHKLAQKKVSSPLFAVVMRLASQAENAGRREEILRGLYGGLTQFSNPTGNEFIALSVTESPTQEQIIDLALRRSRRSGMILNSEELVSLVHIPSASVRSPKLLRAVDRSKAAPSIALGTGLVLGTNTHSGTTVEVALSQEQRLRHTYVLGASGTGKSTFLLNCIIQDLEKGNGVGVLDPHGDLIERVLEHIPDDRMKDVVLLDPADEEYTVGFNILSAHSELEKTLLSSDLVSVFRRLSTSWGDQMTSVLGNAVLAFLESTRGGTLADLRRFLVETDFRKEFLQTVTDDEVVYFWQKEYPLLSGKPQAPLLTRLDTFLRPKLIRRMVSQRENKLDFRTILDGRKILLGKLSQGAIGEENSYLLGTLLVAKLHQAAIGRQNVKESERNPFYLYIDEFQNFVTPSMASILSGARKYGLGLILAHQDLRQLSAADTQVASAVIANPYTRVCFRVGDFDAQKLQDGFSFFTQAALQDLGIGEAICRVERAEYDFNLQTLPLPKIDPQVAALTRAKAIQLSREQYGTRPDTFPIALPSVQFTAEAPPQNVLRESVAVSVDFPSVPQTNGPSRSKGGKSGVAGRGGTQHKYLQELVKRMAEGQGYRASTEEEILGGTGKIDVALRRGDEKIACEISVTSTPEDELLNVQKCIAAGYENVIVVAGDKKALTKIQGHVLHSLETAIHKRVSFLLPEEFLPHLERLQLKQAPSTEKVVRGYRVKVNYKVNDAEENNLKKEAITGVIVQAMRRMKTK